MFTCRDSFYFFWQTLPTAHSYFMLIYSFCFALFYGLGYLEDKIMLQNISWCSVILNEKGLVLRALFLVVKWVKWFVYEEMAVVHFGRILDVQAVPVRSVILNKRPWSELISVRRFTEIFDSGYC